MINAAQLNDSHFCSTTNCVIDVVQLLVVVEEELGHKARVPVPRADPKASPQDRNLLSSPMPFLMLGPRTPFAVFRRSLGAPVRSRLLPPRRDLLTLAIESSW